MYSRILNDELRKAVEEWQKNTGNSLTTLYDLSFPEKTLAREGRSSEMGRKLGKGKSRRGYGVLNRELASKIVRAIGRDPYEFDL